MFEGRGDQTCSQRQEQRNRVAKLCSGHVVQFRHQGRLAHLAEMLRGRLRQSEPVVPISQRILDALEPGDELFRFADGSANSAA